MGNDTFFTHFKSQFQKLDIMFGMRPFVVNQFTSNLPLFPIRRAQGRRSKCGQHCPRRVLHHGAFHFSGKERKKTQIVLLSAEELEDLVRGGD